MIRIICFAWALLLFTVYYFGILLSSVIIYPMAEKVMFRY